VLYMLLLAEISCTVLLLISALLMHKSYSVYASLLHVAAASWITVQ